ncbi:MAG TPA: hypothetical protein VFU99_11265 [Gaiellaceae bacterium]|nr:hypothetical protein [Gaiellaceae bacterium]
MPRQPRYEAPGALHHVVAKGNAGEAIVRNDVDRRGFITRLGRAVVRHRWECMAYCLLDTHFHLVLRTPEPNLGEGMRWLNSTYAQDLNYRHGRTGHVFGGRYYSAQLYSDDHLVAALVYVYLNPVRAGIVELPHVWPWSSYAATVGRDRAPQFVDIDSVLELFGPERTVARARLLDVVAETLELDRVRRVRGQTLRV